MNAKRIKGVKVVKASDRQRVNLRLEPEEYRRLGVHAIYLGMTPGKLVGQLITEHLKAWKVQVNSPAGSDRPAPGAESSPASLEAIAPAGS